ncbi:MAG: carboxypeptidase M32 [Anaerolineae bacterium]|nr:carboxypeptidase M32 [Anaerolineae bacterium]
MPTRFEQLKSRLAQVADIRSASAVLEWDQHVHMPPGSAASRGQHLATLCSLAHSIFVADETGELIEAAAAETAGMDDEADEARLIRVARHDHNRDRRIPETLIAEQAQVRTQAYGAWELARQESSFAHFRPDLERVVDVTSRIAEALGSEESPYDALLDQYEPEMRSSQLVQIFDELKAGLVPLVDAILREGRPVDDTILRQTFSGESQWEFGLVVLKDMGFDTEHGRQDLSAHPFTTAFAPDDVRITTRISSDNLRTGLFGTIHEGGHALYDQGIRAELARSPLFDGASYGIHESQSRLWENVVARSRGFWSHYLRPLKGVFPQQLGSIGLEEFYRAVNKVEPSLIRVEADEVTYCLHVLLRFELEKDLLEQKLAVSDLPDAWNSKMQRYLAVTPPDDARGVLQDVHWADCLMGYFPSYALGSILSVQFYAQATKDVPSIPAEIERGNLAPLREWLRENIHSHGRKYNPGRAGTSCDRGAYDGHPVSDLFEREIPGYLQAVTRRQP